MFSAGFLSAVSEKKLSFASSNRKTVIMETHRNIPGLLAYVLAIIPNHAPYAASRKCCGGQRGRGQKAKRCDYGCDYNRYHTLVRRVSFQIAGKSFKVNKCLVSNVWAVATLFAAAPNCFCQRRKPQTLRPKAPDDVSRSLGRCVPKPRNLESKEKELQGVTRSCMEFKTIVKSLNSCGTLNCYPQ